MLVSLDIKCIRLDQKHVRLAQQPDPMCFWLGLINLISKEIYRVFYSSDVICRFNGKMTAKKK